MCGIVGIVSTGHVSRKITKSLLNLEYRGYDSCGIAILSDGLIDIRKDKGHVKQVSDNLNFHDMIGSIGIGHTRWATTGSVTRENAHPHSSHQSDFALVHNGIISNYRELRQGLENKGYVFQSETDTEVLAHLIAEKFKETGNVEKAIRRMCVDLDGTFAFALISIHDPTHIYAARKESPLIIGIGLGENYIGSDYNAILDYTRNVIPVKDGEYVVMNRETVSIRNLHNGDKISRNIVTLDWDPELSQKGGFPHFMLKEIHEQPSTVEAALKVDMQKIHSLCEMIKEADRVYLIGVGTTFFVAQCAQYYCHSLSGKHLFAVSSDEFEYLSELTEKSLVIAFSQSGETYDTLNALRHAKKYNARTAAVINVMGSTMVSEVDLPIMQQSGPEICVLSTKAAVSQIVIAVRLSLELGRCTGFLSNENYAVHLDSIRKLPASIRRVINETNAFVNNLAMQTQHFKNWLFIGRGIYSAIAQEAALKMKEVTYHHAEGISGGFMKHGTIALIDKSVGSIFFTPPRSSETLFKLTIANAEEIKCRDGFVVGLGFGDPNEVFNTQINLDDSNELCAPILLLVLGQLFAYYSAVVLKRNVDKPRSLAKSVTVA